MHEEKTTGLTQVLALKVQIHFLITEADRAAVPLFPGDHSAISDLQCMACAFCGSPTHVPEYQLGQREWHHPAWAAGSSRVCQAGSAPRVYAPDTAFLSLTIRYL